MKKIKISLLLFSIFNIFLFTGCSSSQNSTDEYKYGVIYSSGIKEKSSIYTYDDNGNYLSNKKINIGGITLASFMKFGVNTGDYVYYACPISENQANNYILQLNIDSLEDTKIKSDDHIIPTIFSVDDKFAYLGNSTLTTTYISKTDLNGKNILKSTEVEGQGIFILEDSKNIYVIGVMHNQSLESSGKIHILDKSTLKLSDTIDLPDLSFVTDAKIIQV